MNTRSYSDARVRVNATLDRMMQQRKLREALALKAVSAARLFTFNASERSDIFKSLGIRSQSMLTE